MSDAVLIAVIVAVEATMVAAIGAFVSVWTKRIDREMQGNGRGSLMTMVERIDQRVEDLGLAVEKIDRRQALTAEVVNEHRTRLNALEDPDAA